MLAQPHLSRLSGVDAGFLAYEDVADHVHPGGVGVWELDGPAPTIEELRKRLAGRLDLTPRLRQRVHRVRLGGRPIWVDDEDFAIERHVVHNPAQDTGDLAGTLALVTRELETPFDRDHPLWKVQLVGGLEHDGFAIVVKVHHALCDGMTAMYLSERLLFSTASPEPPLGAQWRPSPTPARTEVMASRARELGCRIRTLPRPGPLRYTPTEVVGAMAPLALAAVSPRPNTAIAPRVGPRRQAAVALVARGALERIKLAHGGTDNDILVAASAGAIGEWLRERGVLNRGVIHAGLPVDLRSPTARDELGNQIAMLRVRLPIEERDAERRHVLVRAELDRLKRAGAIAGSWLIAKLSELLPSAMLGPTMRFSLLPRFLGTIISCVEAPPGLELDGRHVSGGYVLAWLPERHGLAITAMVSAESMRVSVVSDGSLGAATAEQLVTAIESDIGRLASAAARDEQPSHGALAALAVDDHESRPGPGPSCQ